MNTKWSSECLCHNIMKISCFCMHVCLLFYFICSPLLSCSVIEDHWEFELLCLRPRSDGSWRNHICKTNIERYLQKMLKISAKQRIVSILPKLQLSSSHKNIKWLQIPKTLSGDLVPDQFTALHLEIGK